jgi:hypothetical protein
MNKIVIEYDKKNKLMRLIKYLLFMTLTFLIIRYIPHHKINIYDTLTISLIHSIVFISLDTIAKDNFKIIN